MSHTLLKQPPCPDCQELDPGKFYKDKSRADGLAVYCKVCHKIKAIGYAVA